jgi:hypothetical protein
MDDFNNGFTQTIDAHTPYGIKPFLTTRQAKILQQLPAASVSETKSDDIELTIYPNPAISQITIRSLASAHSRRCMLIDITGREQMVAEWDKNQRTFTIPLAGLSAGFYTILVEDEGQIRNKRFIKK